MAIPQKLRELIDNVEFDSDDALEIVALALGNVTVNADLGRAITQALSADDLAELVAQLEG